MLFNPLVVYIIILASLMLLSVLKYINNKYDKGILTILLFMVKGSVFMMVIAISITRLLLLNDLWVIIVYGVSTGISEYLYRYLSNK